MVFAEKSIFEGAEKNKFEGGGEEIGNKSEKKEKDKRNEDRIVNGYQLDFGQPWYAGLGFNRDPRCFEHRKPNSSKPKGAVPKIR